MYDTFKELGIAPEILKAVEDMGFEEPSPIQKAAIPIALTGKDLIGQAQTGTGKTAAFGIPILERIDTSRPGPQAVVLSPTRELAIQSAEEINHLAQYLPIHALPIYGGQDIERQFKALRKHPNIIVATPGRLMDRMKRGTIDLSHVQVLVLDEGDEMVDMGFIDDIRTILAGIPEERQTMFFSATMPDEAVRRAGEVCLERFLNVMYNPGKRRLEVFYDRDYRSLLDMQSFGHDIEASWLIWDAAETLLPESNRAPYLHMCLTLAEAVRERAFTDHGLENEVVEGKVDHTRVWWVQAETVLGFLNAYELTGASTWLRQAEAQFAYICRAFVDPRPNSEWFWSLSESGVPTDKPIVEEWKCPYHNSRMCLRVMEHLA